MEKIEVARVQQYMRRLFGANGINLIQKKEDHVEVEIHGEFIGTLHRDEEDGEITYYFEMPILEIDLPD